MAEIHAAGMIIEPIICRPASAAGYVVIGPGERRLYASKQLGMKTVPVIVKDLNDVEFDRVRLLENLARKDLSDMETSRVLKYLMDKYPQEYPTQEALAQVFSKTQVWVSQHLAMLQLEKDEIITRVIKTEKLSEGQAREIIAAPPEKREEVAMEITRHIEAEGKPPSMADIRKVSRPDEGQRVRCARCGNPTYKPVDVNGELYCGSCSGIVKAAPKKQESVPKPLIRDQGVVSQETAVPLGFESTIQAPASETEKPEKEEPEPVDTGMLFDCPVCHETYTIIHVAKGKHRFDPLTVMEEEKNA
jgi:ParB/RepB/Spo0J family partition protein